jgi:hypothetical protein
MAGGITDKALYELLKPLRPAYALNDWNEIHPTSQTLHTEIAEKLNQLYLVPLHGLVQNYQSLIREALLVESNSDLREWQDRKSALEAQAKELLGEGEMKSN